MDTNGLPTNGNILANQAAGPGTLPVFKTDAYAGTEREDLYRTDRLTEAEKERIVLECKDARNGEEIKKIVKERVPYEEMGNFLDEVQDGIL